METERLYLFSMFSRLVLMFLTDSQFLLAPREKCSLWALILLIYLYVSKITLNYYANPELANMYSYNGLFQH